MQINIRITERIAKTVGTPQLICGNNDYVAAFTFDSEWDEYEEKTACFRYCKDGQYAQEEVTFTGAVCAIPALFGIDRVEIGVYAGSIRTTTPAAVPCCRCVTDIPADDSSAQADPYDQLMDMIQEAMNPLPELVDGEFFIVDAEGDYITTSSGDYIIAKE